MYVNSNAKKGSRLAFFFLLFLVTLWRPGRTILMCLWFAFCFSNIYSYVYTSIYLDLTFVIFLLFVITQVFFRCTYFVIFCWCVSIGIRAVYRIRYRLHIFDRLYCQFLSIRCGCCFSLFYYLFSFASPFADITSSSSSTWLRNDNLPVFMRSIWRF